MKTVAHESFPDIHHDPYSTTVFGFWVYLLTDFMMFATLFAAYAVLRNGTAGGSSGQELFDLPFTLVQTLLLLFGTFAAGLAKVAAHRRQKYVTIVLFIITFISGAIFLGMQLTEMHHLNRAGNGWDRSAFLSAFFTLIGTHVIHVIFGLLWIIVLLLPVWLYGLTPASLRRLTCLSLFWQFLNLVWIFMFSFIYLLGGV